MRLTAISAVTLALTAALASTVCGDDSDDASNPDVQCRRLVEVDKPPADQLEIVEKLQKNPGSIEGRDKLQKILASKDGEPLAGWLVKLILDNDRRANDFVVMLADRAATLDRAADAGGRLKLGFDGPYLTRIGPAVIDCLENPPKDRDKLQSLRSSYGVRLAIAYVRFHPEDNQAKGRLIKVAEDGAKLPPVETLETLASHKTTGPAQPRPVLMTTAAWDVLIELDVLHKDMPIDEAIRILGPPIGQTDRSIHWYINTPRHVNPGLRGDIDGDKIVKISRYSG